MLFLKLYAMTFAAFIVVDLLWLGVFMKGFYDTQLGGLLRRSGPDMAPVWWAAVIVYLMIPAGILYFVVRHPAVTGFPDVALQGFLFGVILYGVYEFTNYSTLDRWPLPVVVVDTLWGGTLCAWTSAAGLWLKRWLES